MLARPEGPKADTLGVFGSTAALKNGEEEGVLSLPDSLGVSAFSSLSSFFASNARVEPIVGFVGFASLSPSFNNSPNDFLGPANALNVFGDPLKAPNPPDAGAFAAIVVGVGEACAKGDLKVPKDEEEPNVGVVAA